MRGVRCCGPTPWRDGAARCARPGPAKKLARREDLLTPTGVITWRSFPAALGLMAVLGATLAAQGAEVLLTRPGQLAITSVSGEVAVTMGGQRRVAKVDDRVRVDATVAAGRKSLASLTFSNGVVLQLGPESEIVVEELLQAPYAGSVKLEALKEEPSVSRTQVRLVRGELRLAVKPLQVARGSAFVVTMPAGYARVDAGTFYAMVRMTDVGLGICAIELERGGGELELVGTKPAPIPVGRRLTFAVEVDRATGDVKVGEMPPAAPPAKQ